MAENAERDSEINRAIKATLESPWGDVDRDVEISRLVDQALDGVPGTAELTWRKLAAGELSIGECALWAQQVADMVVYQILKDKPAGYERGQRALLGSKPNQRVEMRAIF